MNGVTPPIRVRQATVDDMPSAAVFLAERHAAIVARLGRLEDAVAAPHLIAEVDGSLAGVLSFLIDGDDCEMLTLDAARPKEGIGTALLDAACGVASASGCRRLWLIATNDTTDALRLFQRRGFRLVAVHPGAVDRARDTLKPTTRGSASTGSRSATSCSSNGT